MKAGFRTTVFLVTLILLLGLLFGCQSPVAEIQSELDKPEPQVKVRPTETIQLTPSPTLLDPELEPTLSDEETAIENQETEKTPEVQLSTKTIDYPTSHYIRNITGHSQYYYLSCESSAAIDWAWFFKVNIYESTFQADMPRSDNPDYGYVGDFSTRVWGQIPPYSYGVHAEPIAEGLRAYDLPAKAVKNYSLDEAKQMLSQDKPIIVWIIGNLEYSEPVEYVDKEGRVAIVAPFEHVVILTGYDEDSIRYMNNGKFYDAPTEVFSTSWGVLGNMAVIYDDEATP